MRRILLCAMTGLMLGGCFYRDSYPDERYERYHDRDGRYYRHARWHDEDVYRREDGRWYSRRGSDWVLRADVRIE